MKLMRRKYALAHVYITEGMHEMHSSSVPTSMLAVIKLVRTLISANMCRMHSLCVVHQFLKRKVVVRTQELSFFIKMHYHMFI